MHSSVTRDSLNHAKEAKDFLFVDTKRRLAMQPKTNVFYHPKIWLKQDSVNWGYSFECPELQIMALLYGPVFACSILINGPGGYSVPYARGGGVSYMHVLLLITPLH